MNRLALLKKVTRNERVNINKELLTISRQNTLDDTRENSLIKIIKSYNNIIKYNLTIKDTETEELLDRIKSKIYGIANKLQIIINEQYNEYIIEIILKNNISVKISEIHKHLLNTINEELEEETNSLEENQDLDETIVENKMTTITEFLGLASKLLPEFDGSAENLQRFLDALSIINNIKGEFESTAVEIIKTKLKGSVRNIITTENTIQAIKEKLKNSIKGESVEVLSAKLTNVKQNNKTATAFSKEIEDISKLLENAYISDGLTSELAAKYATTAAVKALAKNTNDSKTKLVMESGNFTTMNEAVAKFINISNDNVSNSQVLYMNKNNQNYQFRNRGRGRGYYQNQNQRVPRYNNNYNNRYPKNYNNRYQNNNRGYYNNRGQNSNRSYHGNNNNRSANVRYTNTID